MKASKAAPRLAGVLMVALGALLVGAIVHIVTVLIVPVLATRDAFARLRPLGQVNATVALERPRPDQRLLPYSDPAVASAFCRFDLGAGPVRVRAPASRSGFASLSFHTRRGSVFYALTDKAAVKGRLDVVVVTPGQLRALTAREDEDDPSQDLRVVATTNEGLVVMRVLSLSPGLYAEAQAQARGLSCVTEPLPK